MYQFSECAKVESNPSEISTDLSSESSEDKLNSYDDTNSRVLFENDSSSIHSDNSILTCSNLQPGINVNAYRLDYEETDDCLRDKREINQDVKDKFPLRPC